MGAHPPGLSLLTGQVQDEGMRVQESRQFSLPHYQSKRRKNSSTTQAWTRKQGVGNAARPAFYGASVCIGEPFGTILKTQGGGNVSHPTDEKTEAREIRNILMITFVSRARTGIQLRLHSVCTLGHIKLLYLFPKGKIFFRLKMHRPRWANAVVRGF